MDSTTITSRFNMCSETNVFTFISPGMRGFLLTPGVFGKLGFSFVLHWHFSPACFHSVLCPCFKRERLTDWGGQMTIQVWFGANPSSGFPTQGRRWAKNRLCKAPLVLLSDQFEQANLANCYMVRSSLIFLSIHIKQFVHYLCPGGLTRDSVMNGASKSTTWSQGGSALNLCSF